MANDAMRELWNGSDSRAWIERPDRYDRMLGGLGLQALDAAELNQGERVLDVGCGSGQLARQAAERVGATGEVVGIDLSAPMVELAVARSEDLPQLRFTVADVQTDELPGTGWDAIVSRFGVMFFDDPVTAFARLHAVAATAGRLAFVAWQGPQHNEWVYTGLAAMVPHVGIPPIPAPGAPGPFAFADEGHVRDVLGRAGWSDVVVREVETTVSVGGGGDIDEVVAYYTEDTFGRNILAHADGATRARAVAALREVISARWTSDGLLLGAAAWVVTAAT